MDWITHEEDVWFEFRGDSPHELTPGRYYRGTVDGYADFGVFVDLADGVTGLLHRSELDQRLESLDWEPGDTVFVQVKNVRDNGDIDLGWSIRQEPDEFRGARIHVPGGDDDGEPLETDDESEDDGATVTRTSPSDAGGRTTQTDEDTGVGSGAVAEQTSRESESSSERRASGKSAAADESATAATQRGEEPEPTGERERVAVEDLSGRVGDRVRIEGEVVTARQTGGPTIFEVRDETGVVDCAAFVEAGVRAYPEIEEGDVVQIDGEVELRHDELQVETEALTALDGEAAETVQRRLGEALAEKARPDDVRPLADHAAVATVTDELGDAAQEIRRAVFDSRPIVVRHAATADGYVAGVAIERAVLPLIREEHARADAEYHYFDRRPLEEPVYDMDAATNDVTRMLEDRERHDEQVPLVVLAGTGSTEASTDGLGLLGIYDTTRVVVDAAPADDAVLEETEVLVNPPRSGEDVAAAELTTGAIAATLAATVNEDVREEVSHLPAVSYWEDTPEEYLNLATDAGFDSDRVARLREAVALNAYYQAYEDKRELIADILFGGSESAIADDVEGDLAEHVSQQFRERLDREVETAEVNLETHETGGVAFAVLDTDAYTHHFEFPSTALLLDELHRRNREGTPFVTLGLGKDELYLRSTDDLNVRDVAERARELAPDAGITALGIRQGRIEFLAGERASVRDAVITAVVENVGN